MGDATTRIERVLGVGITGLIAMVMIDSVVRAISQLWRVEVVTAPYIPLEVAGVDHDNDGILSDADIAAFEAAFGTREGSPSYERRFDINFDGFIEDWDRDVFYATCQEVPNLGIVRSEMESGIYQQLIWPDGEEAWLAALVDEPVLVQKFTGYSNKVAGWIHIHHHPWFSDVKKMEFYLCQHFSMDTTVAAYKALGYGRLLSANTAGAPGHTYNVFWVGGDWQDLHTWRVLEPQSGAIFNAASENLPSLYRTGRILFPYRSSLGTYGQQWHFRTLRVEFAEKVVSYDTYIPPPSSVGDEPKPGEVITTLGIRSLP